MAAFKKGYPKQAKTKKPKNPEKVKEVPKIPLTDKIAALTSLMRLLLSKFFGHLRLDISKIIVTVGAKGCRNMRHYLWSRCTVGRLFFGIFGYAFKCQQKAAGRNQRALRLYGGKRDLRYFDSRFYDHLAAS